MDQEIKLTSSHPKSFKPLRSKVLSFWTLQAQVILALGATLTFGADDTHLVSYNRDVRPIMSDTCFRCHGPDKNARMAEMRLDIRDEALKPRPSGTIPIVPDDPDKSAVIQRIFAKDPALQMPPKYAHKELTLAQKELMRRWIAEGASVRRTLGLRARQAPRTTGNTGATGTSSQSHRRFCSKLLGSRRVATVRRS